jgi:hypothetical protein
MTVYPAEFHKQCEQKWECRAASRLYESAQRMPWLLAIGRTLRAELDAVEQPVSERLAGLNEQAFLDLSLPLANVVPDHALLLPDDAPPRASGHFSAQTARRDSSAVVGVTPTGNRDAGKFAADTTQLPTGCQPESLAKPARRRSTSPNASIAAPEKLRV